MPQPKPVRPGRPREYGKRITTAVRLPLELHQRLRGEAEARGISLNRLIIVALTEWLDGRRRR